jgi:hypothetical protein
VNGFGVSPRRPNRRRDLFGAAGVDVERLYLRATRGKQPRDGGSDAGARAGHDRRFSRQLEHGL